MHGGRGSQFVGIAGDARVRGPEKPLSETEWKAQQLEDAKKKGLITDQDIADIAMGEQELVDVLVEGKPVKMTRGEATRRGLTPVLSKEEVVGTQLQGMGDLTPEQLNRLIYGTDLVKTVDEHGKPVYTPESEAAGMTPAPDDAVKNLQIDDFIAVGPDGKEKRFVGYFDPADMKIHDQDTGAVVPNVVQKGIGTAGLSVRTNPDGTVEITQGGPGGTSRPTDAMMRSAFAAKMSEPSTKRLLAAYDDPALMPSASDMNIWPTLNQMARSESITTATLGRFLNDQAMSPAGREFFLNLTNILPYELMQKSGAATTQTDWATSLASAVPQPNDTPAMRQIRRERLETFIKATYGMAAGTPVVPPEAQATTQPPATAPASSPEAAPAATSGPNKVLNFDAEGNMIE